MSSAAPEPALIVRPTAKFFVFRVLAAGLIEMLAILASLLIPLSWWVAAGAAAVASLYVIAAIPAYSKSRFTRLTLEGDRLRFQEGVLTQNSRMLFLNKIQDVRVDQSLLGRALGIGTLTLETAGEAGRLSMSDVDNPRHVADQILTLARQQTPR
jgi:membrane protein YdbS with pleckstrin-like domain